MGRGAYRFIKKHETVVLNDKERDEVLKQLSEPDEPNETLKKLFNT